MSDHDGPPAGHPAARPASPLGRDPLPHSSEAERAVLASVLLSPAVMPTVRGRLLVEDFYRESHQLLYRAMLDLYEADSEIDLRTLQGRLEHVGTFERVGGLAYMAGLDLDLPAVSRVERYVEIVKERSVRRRLMQQLTKIVGTLWDGQGVDAAEALNRVETTVIALGTEASRRRLTALDELYEETVVQLEKRADGELLGVPSGFADFDRLTEGLVPGSLVIVAGRPGMGKTCVALDIARHVAFRECLPVAFFSLEMSRREIIQRLLSAASGLPFAELRSGRLDEPGWRTLYETIRRTSPAPLNIDDTAAPTVAEITSKARSLQAEQGLALVVVDYLQLLQGGTGRRHENRQQEVTALSRSFKVMAKELEVPVVVLSQLSRKVEERTKNHRPVLADLRESGAIEQDADVVAFVYREEMYTKNDPDVKGLAELIVEKNRNGPTGTVELVFLDQQTSFRSRAHNPTPGEHR